MAQFFVPSDSAAALRRKAGVTLTLVNPGAVDAYFDRDPNRLNKTLPGAVPQGTKLAAGDSLQWPGFPGELWWRAAAPTSIEVQE